MNVEQEDKETVVQIEYHPYELLAFAIIICSCLIELVWLWGKL